MKCFNIILFLFVLNVQATEVTLRALNNEKVSFGDIVKLKVESGLTFDELRSYENKRVSEYLYILELTEGAGSIYYKAILSQKDKTEKIELDDEFKVEGINFEFRNINLNNQFDVVDENITLEKSKKVLFSILSLISLLMIFFLFKFLKKKNIEKKCHRKRKRMNLIHSEPSREQLEKIFEFRKEINTLYECNEEKLKNYINELNIVQFKKEWSTEETNNLKLLYKELVGQLKEKNGI